MTSLYRPQRLIKGCWQLSKGHGPAADGDTLEDVRAFARAGFTTFDCADIYTGAEELLGRLRLECPTMTVHTKFVPDLAMLPSMTRGYVESIIDRSLQRLRAERLDLVQFHWWDFAVPRYVETAQHLQRLVEAGKIARIGVTNCDVEHLAMLIDAGVPVAANQVQYSLLDQRPHGRMTEYCADHSVALLCYGALAGGFLSEDFLGMTQAPESLRNRSLVKYKLVIDDRGGWDWFQALLQTLSRVAQTHDVRIAEVCLNYTLGMPGVASVISGGSARRLDTLVRAESLVLSASERDAIAYAVAQGTPLLGDVYQLERDRSGKHAQIMRYNQNIV